MLTNSDIPLISLLIAALADGPVFLEPDAADPGVSPMDMTIRVDTNATPDEQAAAIRDGLVTFLTDHLVHTGEIEPTRRERMHLVPGGAQ